MESPKFNVNDRVKLPDGTITFIKYYHFDNNSYCYYYMLEDVDIPYPEEQLETAPWVIDLDGESKDIEIKFKNKYYKIVDLVEKVVKENEH